MSSGNSFYGQIYGGYFDMMFGVSGREFQLYGVPHDRRVNFCEVMEKVPVCVTTDTSILNGLLSHQECNLPPVCDLACKGENILFSCLSISVAGLVA